MSERNVVLQNLRDFTVQIRTPDMRKIVGTGVAISTEGWIITCAHVVRGVLGKHPRDANGDAVGVYFPQARGGEVKERRATVVCCFPQPYDDDIALLELTGGPSPLAPEQVAVLGAAKPSEGNDFRSYGYRIYEADTRIALAWAHMAANDPSVARQEAERARTMSKGMGYHWGMVDADEVLARIEEAERSDG